MAFTDKQKQDIINRNYDWLKPYISKVFFDAPEIDNSVTVEGIALEWAKLDERSPKKKHTIKEAIKAYQKSYGKDAKFIKDLTGETLPELKIDEPKTEYIVNEDKSAATLEALQRDVTFIRDVVEADGDPSALMFNDEAERFYGTVLDDDIMKKVQRVNDLLDIVAIGSNAKVTKCEKPNPRSTSAVFAIKYKGISGILNTALKSFREIVETVDEIFVIPMDEETVRISLTLNNVWKEHRRMDDFEMDEEDSKEIDDMIDGDDE